LAEIRIDDQNTDAPVRAQQVPRLLRRAGKENVIAITRQAAGAGQASHSISRNKQNKGLLAHDAMLCKQYAMTRSEKKLRLKIRLPAALKSACRDYSQVTGLTAG
jgi:hypothetical protein